MNPIEPEMRKFARQSSSLFEIPNKDKGREREPPQATFSQPFQSSEQEGVRRVRRGWNEQVAKVEHDARKPVERQPRTHVEEPVKQQPERRPGPRRERVPVPAVVLRAERKI